MIGEDGARQQDQELVRPHDPALPVDHADPVGVAVEGDADVGPVRPYRLLELFQILRDGRVGMVRREGAVDALVEKDVRAGQASHQRSEEHTSELQSLMRISYAVFCLKKKNKQQKNTAAHSQLNPNK